MKFPVPALLLAAASAAGCASAPEPGPARAAAGPTLSGDVAVGEFTAERWQAAETARFWASSGSCVLFPSTGWPPVDYDLERWGRGVVSIEDLVRFLRETTGVVPGGGQQGSIEARGRTDIVVTGPRELHAKVVETLQALRGGR